MLYRSWAGTRAGTQLSGPELWPSVAQNQGARWPRFSGRLCGDTPKLFSPDTFL